MSHTSTSLVSTPQKAISGAALKKSSSVPQSTEAFPPSPGTFRHPRLTEIIARQSATTFTSRDLQNAAVNSGVLVLTLLIDGPIHSILTTLLSSAKLPSSTSSATLIINSLRLLLIVNILLSLRPTIPYLCKKDELTDIPLTPSQRALLGLTPSASSAPMSVTGPADQNGSYITPPRYRHTSGTSTPNSSTFTDRRSISANYSTSPLSTSRGTLGFSPSPQTPSSSSNLVRQGSNSAAFPSSSSTALFGSNSPLTPKYTNTSDLNQNYTNRSTSNFGMNTTTSGLGRSQSLREKDVRRGSAPFESIGPGTPSPSSRRAAAGINYKWLYDKGSRLPKSESMGF